MSHRVHLVFAVLAVFLVCVAVAWGFVVVGSPAAQRLRKLDERRIDDLKTVQSEITNIVYEGTRSQRGEAPAKPLPRTLDDVAQRARVRRVSRGDPATGEPYEYRVIDETHFELCATFALPRDQAQDVAWNHPSGRHCFLFDVANQEGPSTSPDSEASKH